MLFRSPVYLAGESLGVPLAMQVASIHPELVDGMILSAPPVRFYPIFLPVFFTQLAKGSTHPHLPLDMSPYIRRYISNDPLIIEERLGHPMCRNSLTLPEILSCRRFNHSALRWARHVPPDKPVLILQGNHDQFFKPKSASDLLARLHSADGTIKCFAEQGHLLLETQHIRAETLAVVSDWLNQHVAKQAELFSNLSGQTAPAGQGVRDN